MQWPCKEFAYFKRCVGEERASEILKEILSDDRAGAYQNHDIVQLTQCAAYTLVSGYWYGSPKQQERYWFELYVTKDNCLVQNWY